MQIWTNRSNVYIMERQGMRFAISLSSCQATILASFNHHRREPGAEIWRRVNYEEY